MKNSDQFSFSSQQFACTKNGFDHSSKDQAKNIQIWDKILKKNTNFQQADQLGIQNCKQQLIDNKQQFIKSKQQLCQKDQDYKQNLVDLQIENIISGKSNKVTSEFFKQYQETIHQQLFNCSKKQNQKILQQFQQSVVDACKQLNQNPNNSQIRYINGQVKRFQIKSIKTSQNAQVVSFTVELGNFQIQLLMLNILNAHQYLENANGQNHHFQNIIHQLSKKGIGTFGTVYKVPCSQYVIKCVPFASNKTQNFDFLNIRQVLSQLSFLKLAKVLKIGPQLNSLFGFDFIHYPNCIQFSMERCQSPSQISDFNIFNLLDKSLYQTISKLHTLNICHCDIKPENIMFCHSLSKWVLIDFGLSHVVQQVKGYKSLSKFVGTYQYASPQMRNLVYSNQSELVDLYYNDLYAIKRSLKQLHQNQIVLKPQQFNIEFQNALQNIQSDEQQKNQCLQTLFKTYQLQYNLFKSQTFDWLLFNRLIQQKQNIFKYWQGIEIVNFLLQLTPTQNILQFINIFLREKNINFQGLALQHIFNNQIQANDYMKVYSSYQNQKSNENQKNYKTLFKIYSPTKINTYLLPTNLTKYSFNIKRIKGINSKKQIQNVHQNSIIILSYLQRRKILLTYKGKEDQIQKWDFYYCLIDYFLGEKIKFQNKKQEFNTIKQKITLGSLLWQQLQQTFSNQQPLIFLNQGSQLNKNQSKQQIQKKREKLIKNKTRNICQVITEYRKVQQYLKQQLFLSVIEQFKTQFKKDLIKIQNCRKLFAEVTNYCVKEYTKCKQIVKQWNIQQRKSQNFLQNQFYIKNQQTLRCMLNKLVYVLYILNDQKKAQPILQVLCERQQFINFYQNPTVLNKLLENELQRLYNYTLLVINFYDSDTYQTQQTVKKIQQQISQSLNFSQTIAENQDILKQIKQRQFQFKVLLNHLKKVMKRFFYLLKGQYSKQAQKQIKFIISELVVNNYSKQYSFRFFNSILKRYQFLSNFMLARLFRLSCYSKSISYVNKCKKILRLQYKYNNFQTFLINSLQMSLYLSLKNWKKAKLINENFSSYKNNDLQILAVELQQKTQFDALQLCIDLILLKSKIQTQKSYFQNLTFYAMKTLPYAKQYANFNKYFKLASETIKQICLILTKIQLQTQNNFYNDSFLYKDMYFYYKILIQWYWYFHLSKKQHFDFQIIYKHLQHLLKNSLKSRISQAKIFELRSILCYELQDKESALQNMFNCGQFIINQPHAIEQSFQTFINVVLVLRKQVYSNNCKPDKKVKYQQTFIKITNLVYQWIYQNQYWQKLTANIQMSKVMFQVILYYEFYHKNHQSHIQNKNFQKIPFFFLGLCEYVNNNKMQNFSLMNLFFEILTYFFQTLLQSQKYISLGKPIILKQLIKNILQVQQKNRLQKQQLDAKVMIKSIKKCQIICFYLWNIVKSGYLSVSYLQIKNVLIKLFSNIQNLSVKQKKVLFIDYLSKIGNILWKINQSKYFVNANWKSLQKYEFKYNQNLRNTTQFYRKLTKKMSQTESLQNWSSQAISTFQIRIQRKIQNYLIFN